MGARSSRNLVGVRQNCQQDSVDAAPRNQELCDLCRGNIQWVPLLHVAYLLGLRRAGIDPAKLASIKKDDSQLSPMSSWPCNSPGS